jgi:hypothetical protein
MKQSILLALAAIGLLCAPIAAQTEQNASTPQPHRVHKADRRPMPFSPVSENAEPASWLEFRSYDQMTAQDRDLEADAESAIGERAGFAGLEFNQGKWSYRQIVCSALPNHLFLQFTRNNGRGDTSLFSASIPRGDDGRVRIIPIVRRGYSLFSPAPINALTISAFNHIRAEEQTENPPAWPPAWLGTGLCYAALAGAHPQVGPPDPADPRKQPSAPPGRLVIPLHGGALIRFTDVTPASRSTKPMEWSMTFNGKGKLLKATHSAAPQSREKAVQKTPVEAQGKPVHASDPEAKAILIK